MVDFKILRAARRVHSKIATLDDYNDEIRQEQLRELSYLNGSEDSSRGRGIRGRGIRVPPAAPSRFSDLQFTGCSGCYTSNGQQMRADYEANERIFLGKDIVMLSTVPVCYLLSTTNQRLYRLFDLETSKSSNRFG
ncbi:hypothetical protein WISP_63344 [Willisornis vidua]|uniref:Uncharacterized protein n=1 Tax=Willisornis vidua TaxID=1566151 RepID=A0ABQ9DAI8_9PASS|nr:hypothetical protein WISP_63344 [Willisornis vidua]